MSTGKKLDVIGHPRRRIDSREKVTGQLRYADDMKLPRMLHMKLLRSSQAHALIESIDVARAQGHPGVHLVLTGKDFPVPFGIMPVAQDEYPLAPEHVRYVGDPVAAVVATDEQTASRGAAADRGEIQVFADHRDARGGAGAAAGAHSRLYRRG